ncbi:hypothetical protein C1X69_15545 [Pseudomonas sp. FW305-67]|nr:hypothetical protein C1X70_15320 [Pseudomonas sp. FW305-53]PMY85792.1 hypothetical protein C1X68_17355 [Pseudomonas sp. FW303-C2]PMY92426.1 hypothetical protein C1X67_13630 [Pseudomonas sp. FW305-62]PNA42020.1 hypothetical protein C1X71_17430 [Pseudomonas sp. FW306-2-2C-A10BC]PNA84857.1 hypothetical protein C1X66_18760 [Pseudomonas sp. MPR-R3B]PNB20178.1 hypothetical protein C1X69_15545 [Pseudomonas sp. FW305-67]
MPPFECVALTRSSVYQRFWGCFATQRGQAPSPQAAPTGVAVDRTLRLVLGVQLCGSSAACYRFS